MQSKFPICKFIVSAKFFLILFFTFAREVKLLQKTLRQLQAESNKRDAKLFSNMFAKMSKDLSVPTKVSGTAAQLLVNDYSW